MVPYVPQGEYHFRYWQPHSPAAAFWSNVMQISIAVAPALIALPFVLNAANPKWLWIAPPLGFILGLLLAFKLEPRISAFTGDHWELWVQPGKFTLKRAGSKRQYSWPELSLSCHETGEEAEAEKHIVLTLPGSGPADLTEARVQRGGMDDFYRWFHELRKWQREN